MAAEKVVFGHNFEGLFVRGLAERVTPRLRQELKTLGVDLEKPLLPGYPVEIWMRGLRLSAEHVYPEHPLDAAYDDLGRLFIRGYFETMMGKALLTMLRVVGPERTFKRMTQNFRSGNNFTEVESRVVAPGHAEMRINHVLCEHPGFLHGLLAEGLSLISQKTVDVEVTPLEGDAAHYVVRWAD